MPRDTDSPAGADRSGTGADRPSLKGLSCQQIDLLSELSARKQDGKGAQTAFDFEGFVTRSNWSTRRYPITASAARSTLERLVKRGLVEVIAERPRTYGLSDVGWNALGSGEIG